MAAPKGASEALRRAGSSRLCGRGVADVEVRADSFASLNGRALQRLIDPEVADALASMAAHVDAGFTTWDLADHYGPAEDFVGEFRRRYAVEQGEAALADLQSCTKWVPRPGPMPRAVVEAAIATSRRRMAAETLDLLQFHWWDYADRRYFDALAHLADLRDAGAIRHLALQLPTPYTAATRL